ncbi:hypothetical protein [Pseudodesulfovibrio indicus]|uniref:hypothetical protein n=1 Tax=Pseudodesulfovibrio indicus TaxID=1716143 RepID=UPI000B21DA8F|nr:hypothetical protein [Pseudodesulfovibrio indicus]
MDINSVFKEISNWKLEAKQEDVERYFYHSESVDQVVNGEICYVIGRKGAGKTAICEHLTTLSGPTIFTKKLTFKNSHSMIYMNWIIRASASQISISPCGSI